MHRVAFAVEQRHWQAVFIVLALAPAAHQPARSVCGVRAVRAMNVSAICVGNDAWQDCFSGLGVVDEQNLCGIACDSPRDSFQCDAGGTVAKAVDTF